MRWPWSKKPTLKAEEAAKPVDPPEPPNDWRPQVGDWHEVKVCHCGCYRQNRISAVCPKCGCNNQWSTRIEREEWEESPNLRSLTSRAWGLGCLEGLDALYTRNRKTVIWSEGHCGATKP